MSVASSVMRRRQPFTHLGIIILEEGHKYAHTEWACPEMKPEGASVAGGSLGGE